MSRPSAILVQKFGGSVLVDDAATLAAAGEIARAVAQGARVVAVVSARRGVTDRLLREARGVHPADAADAPSAEALDLLLATGEIHSAATLALALRASGVDAEALSPWQIGLLTDGVAGDAAVVHINPLPIRARLAQRSAVVVPGFIGRAADDRLTTLGRGGSDLTAVALAEALGANACEFWKDVPGFFSADPAIVPSARHRPRVTVAEALELASFGCRFLQDKAVARASRRGPPIRLRGFGDERRCELDPEPDESAREVTALTSVVREQDGAPEGLVSLVAHDFWRDPDRRRAATEAATEIDAGARVASSNAHRLTFATSAAHIDRLMCGLHDRLVLRLSSFTDTPSIR